MINPTPWTIEFSSTGSGRINAVANANGDDVRLSGVSTSNSLDAAATTAGMVQAVNSHKALVGALRQCAAELASIHSFDADPENAKAHSVGLRMALDAITRAGACSARSSD